MKLFKRIAAMGLTLAMAASLCWGGVTAHAAEGSTAMQAGTTYTFDLSTDRGDGGSGSITADAGSGAITMLGNLTKHAGLEGYNGVKGDWFKFTVGGIGKYTYSNITFSFTSNRSDMKGVAEIFDAEDTGTSLATLNVSGDGDTNNVLGDFTVEGGHTYIVKGTGASNSDYNWFLVKKVEIKIGEGNLELVLGEEKTVALSESHTPADTTYKSYNLIDLAKNAGATDIGEADIVTVKFSLNVPSKTLSKTGYIDIRSSAPASSFNNNADSSRFTYFRITHNWTQMDAADCAEMLSGTTQDEHRKLNLSGNFTDNCTHNYSATINYTDKTVTVTGEGASSTTFTFGGYPTSAEKGNLYLGFYPGAANEYTLSITGISYRTKEYIDHGNPEESGNVFKDADGKVYVVFGVSADEQANYSSFTVVKNDVTQEAVTNESFNTVYSGVQFGEYVRDASVYGSPYVIAFEVASDTTDVSTLALSEFSNKYALKFE